MTTRNSKQQILQEQEQHVDEQEYLHLRRIPQLYCNGIGRLCCFICQKTFSKTQLLEFATHLHQHRTNMLCVFSEKERMAMRMSSFLNQLRTRTFIETTLAGTDNALIEDQPMEIISPLANLPAFPPLHLENNLPLPNAAELFIPQVKAPSRGRGRPGKTNFYVENSERPAKIQATKEKSMKKQKKEEFDSEITSEEESEEYRHDGAQKKRKMNATKAKLVGKKNNKTPTTPKKKNSEESIYKKKDKPPKEKASKKKTLKRGLEDFLVEDDSSNDNKSFDSNGSDSD
jgi:hypothetical protein